MVLNILYLHGYHTDDRQKSAEVNDSRTVTLIKKSFSEAAQRAGYDGKLNFASPTLTKDIYHNEEAATKAFGGKKIDLVIGNSFGALTALSVSRRMQQSGEMVPILLINPCLNPTLEIPRIDEGARANGFYEDYEEYVKRLSEDLRAMPDGILSRISAVVSDGDSVMAKTYEQELTDWTNGRCSIEMLHSSNHQLSSEEIRDRVLPHVTSLMS